MSFASGTTANANCAKALVDNIKTLLNAHAAYAFVEDVISGTNTTTIYKCLGTVNTHGVDFFIGFYRTSDSATTVSIILGELYNSTTHVMTGQVPNSTIANAAATPDANGYTTSTSSQGSSPSNANTINITVNGTSYNYYLSASNDRLVVAVTSSATDSACYVGAYERLYTALQDPAPLILKKLTNDNAVGVSSISSFTREITAATSVAQLWKAYLQQSTAALGPHATTNQDIVVGEFVAQKCIVGSSTSAARANARGLLRDLLYCQLNLTAVNGDTITVNSETYTRTGDAGGQSSNFWIRNNA